MGVPAPADVDLTWDPPAQTTEIDTVVEITLHATSDDGAEQGVAAMDVLLTWAPDALELIGFVEDDGSSWWMAGFFPDSGGDGLNDSLLDGDAMFTALAPLGTPVDVSPMGLPVVTFQFVVLTEIDVTQLVIEPSLGDYSTTVVFGSDYINQDVTGALGSAELTLIGPDYCYAHGGLRSFARLQLCYTGSVGPVDPPAYDNDPIACCGTVDVDLDGDIDGEDFVLFIEMFDGPDTGGP
jgi:hypothetical protein